MLGNPALAVDQKSYLARGGGKIKVVPYLIPLMHLLVTQDDTGTNKAHVLASAHERILEFGTVEQVRGKIRNPANRES
jgi:hypothetical protein